MSRDLLEQYANHALHQFMIMGRDLGLVAGYRAFQRAAELEDRRETLNAAAWLVLGRVIIVALCSPSIALQKYHSSVLPPFKFVDQNLDKGTIGCSRDPSVSAFASEVRQLARHIMSELSVLIDAGRQGGSISAESVYWLAQNLNGEISALQRKMERLVVICPEDVIDAQARTAENALETRREA